MKKLVLLISLISPVAFGGVHCTEKITKVILHKNSNVYFTTDTTCNSWCQIKWTGDRDKDRAFSALLTAKTADKAIQFYWENLNSCSEKNPTYQSPSYFAY